MFLALAAVATVDAGAQKFQGGEKNLEVQFTPLGGSPIGINGLRFRMFNSESSAIRVGFSVGGSKTQTVNTQPGEEVGPDGKVQMPELYDTEKSFNFSIRPGYEKHFAGTDRLSPYVGGEIIFAMGSETLTREFSGPQTSDDLGDFAKYVTWEMTRKQGTTTFGVNGVAGVDFYFVDNLYMGVELGLGFQSTSYKDRETTASNAEAWEQSNGAPAGPNGGSQYNAQGDGDFDQATADDDGNLSFSTLIGDGNGNYKGNGWGPTFQSTIRLGWLF